MQRSASTALLYLGVFCIGVLGVACGDDDTSSADASADGMTPSMPDAMTTPDGDVPAMDAMPMMDGSAPGMDASSGSDASAPDAGPTPGATLADILSREMFATMFPNQGNAACNASVYTYDALIAAAAFFPAFGTTGSMDDRKRDVAAFLANISHETTGGWATAPGGPESWGLCFREEVGCVARPSPCLGVYCRAGSADYPCATDQSYHGRGPMQLSWNYNYGAFGDSIGMDLLSNPDALIMDGTLGWRAALWFWMTPQAPKPSCHDVMTGVWTPTAADTAAGRMPGFGMTVNIINGGLECNTTAASAVAKVNDRVAFYRRYLEPSMIDGTTGPNLTCETMRSY